MKRAAATLLVACAVLVVPTRSGAQETPPEISTTDLGDGLFLFTGAGGNSLACVAASGVALVDTGYASTIEPLRAAVDTLSESPVRVAVDTHWHFDHVGGNEALAAAGVLIVAHDNVRKRMSSPQRFEIFDRDVPASPAAALPTLTFSKELTLYCGSQEVSLIHVEPAHTDGDTVAVFRQANLIVAGDVFFNCGYPYIDTSHGGSIDGMIGAARWLLDRADEQTRIVPGHGPLASRTDLETYVGMLESFRAAVADAAADGASLEDVIAAHPTAELDAKWGKVFFSPEQLTEMVYRSLPERE